MQARLPLIDTVPGMGLDNVISIVRMKLAALSLLALVGLTLVACSDSKCKCDDEAEGAAGQDSGGTVSDPMSGSAGQAATSDACHDGCLETVAAKCDNGPADQATCESDCHALETGDCGSEYQTLQTCAEGKVISCSAQGLPTVAACSDEQAAFVACLNR